MRVLLLSPHLDDAVFSAGGTAACLAGRGFEVVIATVFSAGPHPATGFALACQRDKGLGDEVDYMALRRAEDARAAAVLGARARWLGLHEAPNRGYGSPAALFGPYVAADDPWPIEQAVARCIAEEAPDLLLAPAALGAHVDHRRVLDAVLHACERKPAAFWRDTPYVLREPGAALDPRLAELEDLACPVGGTLAAKAAAAAAYASQLGFQFGGEAAARAALRALAEREGDGEGLAERFRATPAAVRLLHG